MKFEDFSTNKQFATIINSESLQYIDLDTAFNCVSKLLSNNGKWIITDYFRINNNGMIDVFKSEGSGRISGLSWSTGLVELSEEAMEINIGDRVNFIAYSSYGI